MWVKNIEITKLAIQMVIGKDEVVIEKNGLVVISDEIIMVHKEVPEISSV